MVLLHLLNQALPPEQVQHPGLYRRALLPERLGIPASNSLPPLAEVLFGFLQQAEIQQAVDVVIGGAQHLAGDIPKARADPPAVI